MEVSFNVHIVHIVIYMYYISTCTPVHVFLCAIMYMYFYVLYLHVEHMTYMWTTHRLNSKQSPLELFLKSGIAFFFFFFFYLFIYSFF